ncbi:MAG: fibronectin type III domain-containing protein [Candidatus Kerfeldbacteria bacterium]
MKKLFIVPMLVVGMLFAVQASAAETTDRSNETTGLGQVEWVKIRYRGAHKIKLAFKAVSGADRYVTRVVNPNNGQLITKKRTWTNRVTIKQLKSNKRYRFRVKAKDGKAVSGPFRNRKIKTKFEGEAKSISLSHVGDMHFIWSVDGATPGGQKLVWSKNEWPQYPTESGDYATYMKSDARDGDVYPKDGTGNYYVRVCEYLSDKGRCGTYSNQVKVYLEEPESIVNSIALSDAGDGKVNWSVDGYSSKGFKLVWSRTSGPEYPLRDGDTYGYYSDPYATSGKVYAHDGTGTYFVRVCQYLGGKCGTYSNQISMYLTESSKE